MNLGIQMNGADRDIRISQEGGRYHSIQVWMSDSEWASFREKYPEARSTRRNIHFVDRGVVPHYDYFFEYAICFFFFFFFVVLLYEVSISW